MEFTQKGIHNKHSFMNEGKFSRPVLCRILNMTLIVIKLMNMVNVNMSIMECYLFWNIAMMEKSRNLGYKIAISYIVSIISV